VWFEDDGKVYTWGEGAYGQLGLGREVKQKNSPSLTKASRSNKFIGIETDDLHTWAMTSDFRVFACGYSSLKHSAVFALVEIDEGFRDLWNFAWNGKILCHFCHLKKGNSDEGGSSSPSSGGEGSTLSIGKLVKPPCKFKAFSFSFEWAAIVSEFGTLYVRHNQKKEGEWFPLRGLEEAEFDAVSVGKSHIIAITCKSLAEKVLLTV